MTYYRFPDTKLSKIGIFLYLYALQAVARNTMYTNVFLGFYKAQVIMLLLVAVGGLAFLIANRRNLRQIVTDRRVAVALIYAAVILLPMIIKQDWQMMYGSILLYILFAVFLSYFLTVQEAAGHYVALITAVSVLTLLAQFVLKPMTDAGFLPAFPFKSAGGWDMYNFGLTFACNFNEHGAPTFRTFGIFREPGLYQIFLFIAIQLNNDVVRWKQEWKMWAVNAVLFAALLVTFAIGGVLALGLYIVFLFFDKGLYRNRKLQILAVAAVAAGIAAIVVALIRGGTWAYELVGMVEKIYKQTDSYTSRVDSIFMDAKIFLQHPVVGAPMQEVMYSVPNNTATSPILFASFGILGGILHVLSWAALAWKKERHWIMNLILMVIILVPFNTQNVMGDMFFWMFPMMALTEKILTRKQVA